MDLDEETTASVAGLLTGPPVRRRAIRGERRAETAVLACLGKLVMVP